MDSADSFLPFQDWRWLVTRRGADEKPVIACHRKVLGLPRNAVLSQRIKAGQRDPNAIHPPTTSPIAQGEPLASPTVSKGIAAPLPPYVPAAPRRSP